MKKQLLDQIIKKKKNKDEFAIITNIENGESCIFEKNNPLDKNFEKYFDQINNFFRSNICFNKYFCFFYYSIFF